MEIKEPLKSLKTDYECDCSIHQNQNNIFFWLQSQIPPSVKASRVVYMAFTTLQTHQIQANVTANDQKVRKTTRKVATEATMKTHGKPFFLFLFFLFFFFFSLYLQQTALSSTTHTSGVANKPELQQATDSKNNQKNIPESEMSVRLFDHRERGASVVYHLEFCPANHRGYPRRHTLSLPEACHHSAEYQPRISSGLGDENQSRAIGPGGR
jgi:ABC-type Zn2+ transport system substrate-binding protein/surface adhesin